MGRGRRVDLGTVTTEEMATVSAFVHLVRSGPGIKQGVAVLCRDGVRVWQIADKDAHVEIRGEAASFDEVLHCPVHLVYTVRDLCQMGDPVHLAYEDRRITASGPTGEVSLVAGPGRTHDSPVHDATSVRATGPIRRIFRAFEGSSDLPMEALLELGLDEDDDEDGNSAYPDARISVADGSVSCATDWSRHGIGEVRTRTTAVTVGTGTVRVGAPVLNNLACLRVLATDDDATIAFDPVAGSWLLLACGPWRLALKTSPSPSQRVHRRVERWLRRANPSIISDDRGTIAADHQGTPMRVTVLEGVDGGAPIVRCTSVVLRDATATHDLLAEINAFNLTLTTSRVWYDRGMVVVGSDVVADGFDIATFGRHYRHVATDAKRLSGLLAPLAATPG